MQINGCAIFRTRACMQRASATSSPHSHTSSFTWISRWPTRRIRCPASTSTLRCWRRWSRQRRRSTRVSTPSLTTKRITDCARRRAESVAKISTRGFCGSPSSNRPLSSSSPSPPSSCCGRSSASESQVRCGTVGCEDAGSANFRCSENSDGQQQQQQTSKISFA